MAEFPIMPFYIDSYLSDTTGLTNMEHGTYLLLLFAMWRAGGGIPNDDDRLARIAHLTSRQWLRVKPTIMRLCRVEGSMLTQGKLLETIANVQQKSKKNADSARARWLKTKGLPHAFAVRMQSERNAIQISKITTSEQEPAPEKRNGQARGASREAVPLAPSPELVARLSAAKPVHRPPTDDELEIPAILRRTA